MKSIAIIYHSNLFEFIDTDCIFKCIESISEQTFSQFDILELNYGNDVISLLKLFSNYFKDNKKYFDHKPMKNHVDALNYCLTKCFDELDYDIVFNINLDDFYNINRFQIQYDKILHDSYDLVTSNIKLFQEVDHKIIQRFVNYIKTDLTKEQESYFIKNKILFEKKNVLSLSPAAFTKIFWLSIDKKIDDAIPVEDFFLWKKLLQNNPNIKIHISRHHLCNYRIHDNQCSSAIRPKYI